MLSRDRLFSSAVGGFLTIAIFVSPLYAQEQNSTDHSEASKTYKTEQNSAPQLPAVVADGEEPHKTNWADPHCAQPQTHDEADLCEQWRMRESAEKTVLLNAIQTGLGMAGAVLLLATLIYSRWATNAAAKAADAAKKAADAVIDIERPTMFLQIGPAPLEWRINGRKPEAPFPAIKYKFKNFGKTPAIIDHWMIVIDAVADISQREFGPLLQKHTLFQPVIVQGYEISHRTIEPRFSKGKEMIERLHRGDLQAVLWGYIRFADVFSWTHTTYFCWVYDRRTDCMAQHGGTERNYTKIEPPPEKKAGR